MELIKQVWHGRYYEAGTKIFRVPAPVKKNDIKDKCGCANYWVALVNNPKDRLNIWECEAKEIRQ
jgi:hypothetical protein